ncbi:hypothetical protein JTE90_013433 [Oedothorax gibbosus]|uniref:UNC93-like protein n=1 Tax=Oedothorax gibbosus TaxID=931172 RepID=A0AAV6UG27_9ARAC|nr:hypothetical protein JTE90_013433 [Oedothorax gibbosus]
MIANVEDLEMASIKQDLSPEHCMLQKNSKVTSLMEKKEIRKVRKETLVNLFVFSLSYFLVYTGFWSLSNLQSTMNAEDGIGEYSQAVIYICSMVSSLFLPKFLIGTFGCKKIIIVGTVICCVYIASNMYLRLEIMVPASILYGIANGPFISAQAYYIDEMATRFQTTVNQNREFVMALFFGLCMFFAQNTQIWGNVIAYYVLSNDNKDDQNPAVSASFRTDCGIEFRSSENIENANLEPPSEHKRFLLVGIYVCMGLMAALLLGFCLKPLNNDLLEGRRCRTICERFLSTLKRLKNPQQLLLIPLSIFVGMEGPFYTNEVTEAFIACSWGVDRVGLVTLCFGVCGAAMALAVGPLVKQISQRGVLILAACANLAMCVALFFWKPSPDFTPAYFIVAGAWGMGDSIWWSQVPALYGLMFPNDREATFSNLYFWSFLGCFMTYSYANHITIVVKLGIFIFFLVTGLIGYLTGQYILRCASTMEYAEVPKKE